MSDTYMLIEPEDTIPSMPEFVEGIRRAPSRGFHLTQNCIPKAGYMDTGSVRKAGFTANLLMNIKENV